MIPAMEVAVAPRTVRLSSGTTDSVVAATISSSPKRARVFDGVRGSLRDSATASVAGMREVRHAALRADTCTARPRSRTVASAGSGLNVSGRASGITPRSTSIRRNWPASR